MRKALCAWVAVLAWVAAYDVWAMRHKSSTLSSAFRYGSRHKHGRFVIIPAWVLLTTHLFIGTP